MAADPHDVTHADEPMPLARRLVLTYVGMLTGPVVGAGLAVVLVIVIVEGAGGLGALGVGVPLALAAVVAGWCTAVWHCRQLDLGGFTGGVAGSLPVVALVVAGITGAWEAVALVALTAPALTALASHRRSVLRRSLAAVLASLVVGLAVFVWGPQAGGLEPAQRELLTELERKPFALYGPMEADQYRWSPVTAERSVEYAVTKGDTRYVVLQWQEPSPLDSDLADGELAAARGGEGGVVLRRDDTWITVRAWTGPGKGRQDDDAARDFALALEERSPRWLARHSG